MALLCRLPDRNHVLHLCHHDLLTPSVVYYITSLYFYIFRGKFWSGPRRVKVVLEKLIIV